MTIAKRFTAVFAAIITLISCLTFSASAANVCKEINGKTDYNGGVSTTFYVKAKDKKKHYVKMDMTKGKFRSDEDIACGFTFVYKNIYDYYEVKVYGKKADGSYTQISKTNVKNKGSYKIEFKGYKDYKITVYSWKTATINKSGGYYKHPLTKELLGGCEWASNGIPTWRICKTSGVTLCR